jgi:hypothetical protein
MNLVTQSQFEQIKANFAKLKNELNKEKLAEFHANAEFFKGYAPWSPSERAVSRHQWQTLLNEVKSALNTAELHAVTGETANYTAFKANAEKGVLAQPDNKTTTHAELMERARKDPAWYSEMRASMGGMTKEQLKREIPQ